MTEHNIKVCHFTSVHHWNDIRIFEKECVALAEFGYEVHLVAPNAEEGLHKGVHVHSVNFKAKSRLDRMRNLTRLVYEKALAIDADIYHFHDPELLPYGLKLQKKGKKLIYDAHEDVPAEILHKGWIKPALLRNAISSAYNYYEKNTTRKLSGLISVVDIITDKFQQKNKITLKNYPDLSHFQNQTNTVRKNVVIYSGGLMRKRGIKEMIQAVGLTKTRPQFIIFGKWESDAYHAECMQEPGWELVDFRGFVPVEETYQAMAEAKIGLTLLLPVSQNAYSLPLKSFEYMSAGLACIMSDFEFWKQQFGDCALYCNPYNTTDVAQKIDALIESETYFQELASKGKKLVDETYNWQSEKYKLHQFYQQILGTSKPNPTTT